MSEPPASDESQADRPQPDGPHEDGPQLVVPQPQAVRAALVTIPPSEPASDFWDELDRDLEQGTPLHLAPRPAIRPITEPPPASGTPGKPIEDVFDRGGHRGPAFGRRPGVLTGTQEGMSRKRLYILVAVAVVVALLAVGSLLGDSPDDPDLTTGDGTDEDGEAADESPDDGEEDTADGDGGDGGDAEAEAEAGEETPETTLPPEPQTLGEDNPLQPGGVGLVRVGTTTLREMGALEGVEPEVNHSGFNVSGGRCFDVTVPGADGITWWVASPTGEPLAEPEDGVVVAVSLSGVMSPRGSEDGFGLGTPGAELQEFYQGRLQTYANPFNSGGRIYVASATDGTGTALAYWTNDDDNVAEIRAGQEQLLARPDMCL